MNATGVLMEYEDMFPYSGELAVLARNNSYTVEEIHEICQLAKQNKLDLIPLVPTFGNVEFILKHKKFSFLKEKKDQSTICPSNGESAKLIKKMLRQIYRTHSKVSKLTSIHIGMNDPAHYAEDKRCKTRVVYELNGDRNALKLDHLTKIASYVKQKLKVKRVLVWHDILVGIDAKTLNDSDAGSLISPVLWHYDWNSGDDAAFPSGTFAKFAEIFDNILFAGAFKGSRGEGQNMNDIYNYLHNVFGHIHNCGKHNDVLNGTLSGMILTGRSRYKHASGLCELLPENLPTLVAQLHFLSNNYRMEEKNLIDSTVQLLEYPRSASDPLRPKIIETSKFELFYAHTFTRPVDSNFVDSDFPGNEIFIELEKLRLVEWKMENLRIEDTRLVLNEIDTEKQEIEKRLRPALLQYFYEKDVDEWFLVEVGSFVAEKSIKLLQEIVLDDPVADLDEHRTAVLHQKEHVQDGTEHLDLKE
ncbi:hypothetical protein QR680_006098 [Steinernema hermaphroditum]|uniref:Beta-N-acetylhexosaminidase n=1 Tax=Steinernema hermaphroditum TaxID=289476 RepID=A0AA39HUA4_9BILA|nr:hypothetical protein QR680_006098 [Steinernema hermaphroditum]